MKDTATGWTQGEGFFPLSRPTSSPSQPLCHMHTPHAFHSFALSPAFSQGDSSNSFDSRPRLSDRQGSPVKNDPTGI